MQIDIKPGEYPNYINLKSRGLVPVAILTTPEFDAGTVDPGTVEFAGARPFRRKGVSGARQDVDGDGDVDLLLQFRTEDLVLEPGATEAALTGRVYSGDYIEGSDTISLVPAG